MADKSFKTQTNSFTIGIGSASDSGLFQELRIDIDGFFIYLIRCSPLCQSSAYQSECRENCIHDKHCVTVH